MAERILEADVIIEHLIRFRGVTLQMLEMVPEEKLDWRPDSSVRSFAEVFLHLAQVEEFYTGGIFNGSWSFESMQMPGHQLTKDFLKPRLKASRTSTQANLDQVDSARLDAIVAVPHIPTKWSIKSWLWYLVEHEVHHKAQLALYFRLIDLVPPFFAFVLPPGVRPDVR
ncbi:MAG TPA: DinB family protein [Pyrinomonadaceae bacterium]|nr:DinB family protein [Pyrinomonadaceae bacterium]